MIIFNRQIIVSVITVLIAAVVFVLVLLFGIRSGRESAYAAMIATNTSALTQALDFFYSDQDRYPTTQEFSPDGNLSKYIEGKFSLDQIAQNRFCASDFKYLFINRASYSLSFCLPASSSGFNRGWNQISKK